MFRDYGNWGVTPKNELPEWIKNSVHQIVAYRNENKIDFYEAQKGIITTPAQSENIKDEDGLTKIISHDEIRDLPLFNSNIYYLVRNNEVIQCENDISAITPEGQIIGYTGSDAEDVKNNFHNVMQDYPENGRFKLLNGEIIFEDISLDTRKLKAKNQVVDFANSITSKILSRYPDAEQKLWPDFRKEALAFDQNDGANNVLTDFPVLTKMLESKLGVAADDNETLARLSSAVPSILANAATWSAIAEYVAGLRGRVFAQLEVANNQAEIDAILTTAKTEAMDVAASYGLV